MVGCPTCGAELTYIPPYGRHYCYGCRSYAPKTLHPCEVCGRALVFIQQYHRYYCYGCQEYKENVGIRNSCPTCGGELEHIPQYNRFYCFQCRAYAPQEYGITGRIRGGRPMTKDDAGKEQIVGYAPFSREDMDLASKEQLMNWCKDYSLDDGGMKYELRLRLLEHVRKQGLLLKGEKPGETQREKAPQPAEEEVVQEAAVVEELEEPPRAAEEASAPPRVEVEEQAIRPLQRTQEVQNACPTCGKELAYIPQYGRWYCYSCQSYAPSGTSSPVSTYPAQSSRQQATTAATKIRKQRQGNPMVGISLAIVGLLMFVVDELLYRAPAVFDIPVLVTAPEIDFALRFLSIIFIALGLIAAIVLVRARR